MATTHHLTAQAEAATAATANLTVRRGQESWNYFYILIGLAISTEGSVISMITPLIFPYNVISFIVVGVITFLLFIRNGWFHNKLLGWKNYYESRPH
jgi:hypothetical protein